MKLLSLLFAFFVLSCATAHAQITVPFTFSPGTTIQSSQVNSDFNTLATQALNNTGGTMTGALNTQAVAPTVDATYNLGTGALRYLNGSFSGTVTAGTVSGTTGSFAGTVTAGTVSATTFTGVNSVPAGAILYFNTTSCPAGWAEFTSARGLYIVGLPASGTLATGVGTALTNLENRPTGIHSHSLTMNPHGHTFTPVASMAGSGNPAGVLASIVADHGSATPANDAIGATASTLNTTSTGTVNNSTGVAGTNAPYLQLLVCQKS